MEARKGHQRPQELQMVVSHHVCGGSQSETSAGVASVVESEADARLTGLWRQHTVVGVHS